MDLHRRGLEITTVKNCTVDCDPFCPQKTKFRGAYGDRERILQYSDFELAMSKTPKDVMIIFAGFCEPFLNPRAMDMIELAKAQGHTVTLSSTLVHLDPRDVPRLKAVDWFSLHAPDNSGVAHIVGTQNYKDALFRVLSEPGIRVNEIVRMDVEAGFFPEDRAGNASFAVEGALPTKRRVVRGPFRCSKLVKAQPVMLPNLTLQLCCEDWSLQHPLGSLRDSTYDEIVNGDVFRLIAESRWRAGGDELCRSCSRAWSLPKAAAIGVGWPLYQRLYKWARKESQI